MVHHLSGLSKKTNLENAFEIFALSAMTQIELNAALLVKNYDAEALHQMRVGLRRFKALCEVYHGLFKLPETLSSELHWVNQTLSESRDLDILINSTLPMVFKKVSDLKTAPNIKLMIANQAKDRHKKIRVMVNSVRFKKLMYHLKESVTQIHNLGDLPFKDQSKLHKRIDQIAPIWLSLMYDKLMRQGIKIKHAKRKKLHHIRISIKRLRYISECLQPIYQGKSTRQFIKKLSNLQSIIGFLNDASVANLILKEVKSENENFLKNVKIIRKLIHCLAQKNHKKINVVWDDFKSAKCFWETKNA